MKDIFLFLSVLVIASLSGPSVSTAMTIGGAVRQPLNLSISDLERFGSQEVRMTDYGRDKNFHGVFVYQGVPLRNLLQVAAIAKDGPGFNKTTDLAVVVRAGSGKSVVLSWGEIFYKNPSNVMIAFAANPVRPHHASGCGSCHGPDVYKPALDQLDREVGFPKLIVANDSFSDRSLEDVVGIEVVDPGRDPKKGGSKASTALFTMVDEIGAFRKFYDLEGFPTNRVSVAEVGDGRGFHGFMEFEGVSLRHLIQRMGIAEDMDRALLVTSTDGYRALVSFGEIFLSPLGDRIILAEHKAVIPGEEKKFTLVIPDDLAADRDVKTVTKMEVVTFKKEPKVYVIGAGSGDPQLLTLEAISAMGRADAFIVSEEMAKSLAVYMGEKPVLFDPMLNYEPVFRRKNPGLSNKEAKKKLEAQRAADMVKIRQALDAGKVIALLDHGDPTIYGGWQHWLEPEVGGRFEVITGVSAFNAANAMFANQKIFSGISAFSKADSGNLLCNSGSVILTAPASLAANEGLIKAAAANGDTMAIFMGLGETETLVPLLKKYYEGSAPVAIAYKAGYLKQEKIVRTVLDQLGAVAAKESEKMVGMIYIGSCLK